MCTFFRYLLTKFAGFYILLTKIAVVSPLFWGKSWLFHSFRQNLLSWAKISQLLSDIFTKFAVLFFFFDKIWSFCVIFFNEMYVYFAIFSQNLSSFIDLLMKLVDNSLSFDEICCCFADLYEIRGFFRASVKKICDLLTKFAFSHNSSTKFVIF